MGVVPPLPPPAGRPCFGSSARAGSRWFGLGARGECGPSILQDDRWRGGRRDVVPSANAGWRAEALRYEGIRSAVRLKPDPPGGWGRGVRGRSVVLRSLLRLAGRAGLGRERISLVGLPVEMRSFRADTPRHAAL